MEVDDYDRMVERFNGDPVAQRWEEEMADLIEYPEGRDGWPRILDEVWSL
jgi:L-rhamnose mutarotase